MLYEVITVALSIDLQDQLVSSSSDGVVRLWDLTAPAPAADDGACEQGEKQHEFESADGHAAMRQPA